MLLQDEVLLAQTYIRLLINTIQYLQLQTIKIITTKYIYIIIIFNSLYLTQYI